MSDHSEEVRRGAAAKAHVEQVQRAYGVNAGETKTAAAIILEKRAEEARVRQERAAHLRQFPPTDARELGGALTHHTIFRVILRPDDEAYFMQRTDVPSREATFSTYPEAAHAEVPKGWHVGCIIREVNEIVWQRYP